MSQAPSDDFTLLGLFATIIAHIGIGLVCAALFFAAVAAIFHGTIFVLGGIYWLLATYTMTDLIVLLFLVGICLIVIGISIETARQMEGPRR